MKLHRRDYARFAKVFFHARQLAAKGYKAEALIDLMAQDVADILAENHATFQPELFLQACGTHPEVANEPNS